MAQDIAAEALGVKNAWFSRGGALARSFGPSGQLRAHARTLARRHGTVTSVALTVPDTSCSGPSDSFLVTGPASPPAPRGTDCSPRPSLPVTDRGAAYNPATRSMRSAICDMSTPGGSSSSARAQMPAFASASTVGTPVASISDIATRTSFSIS